MSYGLSFIDMISEKHVLFLSPLDRLKQKHFYHYRANLQK